MQVQSIQTTNNCRKPCFKAYFVNDAKGIFNNLWIKSEKTPEILQKMNDFANVKPDHALEILSSIHSNYYYTYEIINHFTGKYSEINIERINLLPKSKHLCLLIDKLSKDRGFFQEATFSKVYRTLTGQEKPKLEL